MARPISDEELQLKKRARRRLVGAIVLVAAVAVVLPMVLDSEPKSVSQNVDIQIPSPDSGEFKPKGAPAAAPVDPPAPVSAITEPAPSSKREAKATESKGTEADNAKPPKESAPVKETASSKEASSAAPGTYVIQVEALADPAKARQLEKKVASAGLKTYTEVVNTQSGELTRVRAGPFPTREAAEKARTQLKKAGLDGKVVPK